MDGFRLLNLSNTCLWFKSLELNVTGVIKNVHLINGDDDQLD